MIARTVSLGVLALALTAPPTGAAEPPPALQGATLYHLEVRGMVCPFCAFNVEQLINDLNGVQYVEVNVDKGLVAVAVKAGANLRRKRLAPLFTKAGFELEEMREVPVNRDNLAIP